MNLRPYQVDLENDYLKAFNAGAQAVMPVLPCGGGKTQIMAKTISETRGAAAVIAHRKELLQQISLTLGAWGVQHRIIAPPPVVTQIIRAHIKQLGASFYYSNSPKGIVSIDFLLAHYDDFSDWLQQVKLAVIDEGHHVQAENKWGRGLLLFPRAKYLGFTATAIRADGKGLGRSSHGLMDALVEGPCGRDLINMGWLSDYEIVCPETDLDHAAIKIGRSGEVNKKQVAEMLKKSPLVGDVVENYLKFARGRRGITFAHSVEASELIAAQYNAAGVPAMAVDGNTDPMVRERATQQLNDGSLLNLVNVDLFGEGYDVPKVEVVSMARPTKSYGVCTQQFGRALRISEGKKKAMIIDHVGNLFSNNPSAGNHGLPDLPRVWSLEPADRGCRGARIDPDVIPERPCLNCSRPYKRSLSVCPACGHGKEPGTGRTIEEVDGDLTLLSAEVLAKMRGEVEVRDSPCTATGEDIVARSIRKQHRLSQQKQNDLRRSIAIWSRILGVTDKQEFQRMFFLRFGLDLLKAQALSKGPANKLATVINLDLGRMLVDNEDK